VREYVSESVCVCVRVCVCVCVCVCTFVSISFFAAITCIPVYVRRREKVQESGEKSVCTWKRDRVRKCVCERDSVCVLVFACVCVCLRKKTDLDTHIEFYDTQKCFDDTKRDTSRSVNARYMRMAQALVADTHTRKSKFQKYGKRRI